MKKKITQKMRKKWKKRLKRKPHKGEKVMGVIRPTTPSTVTIGCGACTMPRVWQWEELPMKYTCQECGATVYTDEKLFKSSKER